MSGDMETEAYKVLDGTGSRLDKRSILVAGVRVWHIRTKEADDVFLAILLEDGLFFMSARVAVSAVVERRIPVLGSGHDSDIDVFQVLDE
jgi:hypothetical protein